MEYIYIIFGTRYFYSTYVCIILTRQSIAIFF